MISFCEIRGFDSDCLGIEGNTDSLPIWMFESIGEMFSRSGLDLDRGECILRLVETDFGRRFRMEEAEMLPKNRFSDISAFN